MSRDIGSVSYNQNYTTMTNEIQFNELWDYLIETQIATEDECRLVCSICGSRLSSLESILYSRVGYRTLEQVKEMED